MSTGAAGKWARYFAVLGSGLALLAGWKYESASLHTLRERETEAMREIADLSGRIEKAQEVLAAGRDEEGEAGRIQSELKRLQDALPTGSAMVSLPAIVKGHFESRGVPVQVIRLNATREEPGIPGYDRDFWSVAIPIEEAGRNMTKFLRSVADLDRENPFMRILDLAVRPDPMNPGRRLAMLNVTTLVRK